MNDLRAGCGVPQSKKSQSEDKAMTPIQDYMRQKHRRYLSQASLEKQRQLASRQKIQLALKSALATSTFAKHTHDSRAVQTDSVLKQNNNIESSPDDKVYTFEEDANGAAWIISAAKKRNQDDESVESCISTIYIDSIRTKVDGGTCNEANQSVEGKELNTSLESDMYDDSFHSED